MVRYSRALGNVNLKMKSKQAINFLDCKTVRFFLESRSLKRHVAAILDILVFTVDRYGRARFKH